MRKGLDIRRVLERRLVLWSNEEFDLLVDEAVRCGDRTIRVNIRKVNEDHFVSVFTRLMLHGKTRAAVRWLSDHSKGRVLPSDNNVELKDNEGEVLKTTVLDVLKKKHPEPQSPPVSTLLKCDPLPPRLDLEVTGVHIHFIVSRIQGSAGPSGTDAGHWQDVLLRYGAHSNRLHDSVAALVRRLSNSVTPWEDVCALVACRLVALDKCPGVVQLQQVDPSYGYYPEPTKCVLVVNRDHIPLAHQIFDSFGVEITTSHRLLGGVVGDVDSVSSHIEHCVNDWLSLVDRLVLIARTQPQLAYSAFTRSVQSKWLYLQRVVPNCGSFFASLEHLISEQLLPTIFGCEISLPERTL